MVRKVEAIDYQDPTAGQSAAALATIETGTVVGDGGDEGRIRSGRLAGLTMWRAIFVLSWPVLIESLLNATVGLVDTTLAAGISVPAADAVAGASYITWFIGLVGLALGVGAAALISRAMGRGRIPAANAALGQCALIAVVAGCFVGALMAVAAPAAASWMSLSPEASEHCITFLRINALAVPVISITESFIACCRAVGDSVKPLMAMAIVNAVNIVASIILSGVDLSVSSLGSDGLVRRNVLFHNPFPFDMGVAGIAAGTVIAWVAGAAMMIAIVARGTHGLRLTRKRLRPHRITIIRLLRVGIPNFLETFGMWFGNFLTLLMVGWMHAPGVLGAHVVAIRVEAFSFLPGFAMSLAAATLAGQYLGAGSPRLARIAVIRCARIAGAIMGLAGLLFVFAPGLVVGLFTPQARHLELTPQLLMVCGVIQIPFAYAMVARGGLRGAGATRSAMWITWISIYAIRLPLAWIFCGVDIPLPEWIGGGVIANPAPLQAIGIEPIVGFWIGLCSEIVIRCVLFLTAFLRGSWARLRV